MTSFAHLFHSGTNQHGVAFSVFWLYQGSLFNQIEKAYADLSESGHLPPQALLCPFQSHLASRGRSID
ncbi:hypothetical protein G6O67_004587 [Ophiocordyceps sinensis]|uniref:Uncharacterized protein n=1 Tax=Ophiocordyceps sinensis TaxID=72228 RepID=A0A8H4V4Q3_9HYPO|nr:hypothetical protein G6O67_004587 [Ophiocordyceps sinensis]